MGILAKIFSGGAKELIDSIGWHYRRCAHIKRGEATK